MFLSSIFSFDTLTIRWRMPRCVLFAVMCIGLMEILIGRTDFVWRLVPGSYVDTLLALEDVIIQRNLKPKVLIFGSSSAHDILRCSIW